MMPDTLWYTRCPVPTAFAVAIDLGLFEDEFAAEGVSVRSLASSTDVAVRQSHFHHSQANSFRHGGNGPPLVSRSRGADSRLIALSWNESIKPILALPGSGIRTMDDLRGRRISIPIRASDSIDFWKATALRGLEVAFDAAGLTFDDVKPTDVSTQRSFMDDATTSNAKTATLWNAHTMLGHQREEAFALIRGEVDALYSQGSIAAILQGFTGAVTVFDNASLPSLAARVNNDSPLALTVSGKLLDECPDAVVRVLARVLQAGEWARGHAREAKRIIAADTGIPEELVDETFTPCAHEHLGIDLSPELVDALRVQHDHLVKHGFVREPVDFKHYVAHEPLLRARELAARLGPLPLSA